MAKDSMLSQVKGTFGYVYNHIKAINDSKLFAGLIVIILNVSSKFTTVPISKTMESYLKNTFSRHILVFAIAWMGTRDVFIALTSIDNPDPKVFWLFVFTVNNASAVSSPP